MTDRHDKLNQQFQKLPDAEPPFGLDSRIEAQARAHLEQQRAQRASKMRWSAGLATLACAALVFVIARPLLQRPPLRLIEEQPMLELESFSMEQLMPARSSDAMMESADSQQKSSAGMRAKPKLQRQLEASAPAVPASAAPTAVQSDFSVDQLPIQEHRLNKESMPSLKELLRLLKQYQESGQTEQMQQIKQQLRELYPEHRLENNQD